MGLREDGWPECGWPEACWPEDGWPEGGWAEVRIGFEAQHSTSGAYNSALSMFQTGFAYF